MIKPNETYIDLHVHSIESDGTFTPEELIRLAAQKHLAAIALTDHDTINGLPAARKAAHALNVELVPGIELSTDYNHTEVHILGYYIDEKNPTFLQKLNHFCSERENRNRKMVQKLQHAGFDITYESLTAAYPNSVLTRAHFARYLADHNMVQDMRTAFCQYLGNDCSCYVPREKITPFEAIDLIASSGGLAFFAHPILCRMNDGDLESFIKSLASSGLTGLEAIYSTYTKREEQLIKNLAQKYQLLISGGSDFHGSNKPHIQLGTGTGNLQIPYDCLLQMKDRIAAVSPPCNTDSF